MSSSNLLLRLRYGIEKASMQCAFHFQIILLWVRTLLCLGCSFFQTGDSFWLGQDSLFWFMMFQSDFSEKIPESANCSYCLDCF